MCIICIYQPETDTFIGMRMFPTVHHKEVPNVSSLLPWGFFIIYCTLANILSHIHTYITEGSILISEFLSLKPGIWLSP